MTIMNTELYEALKEAGASDEKAKAASNVVEEQNKRFDNLDHNLTDLTKDMKHGFETLETNTNASFKANKSSIETIKFEMKHMESRIIFKLTAVLFVLMGISVGIILGGMKMMLP